MNEYNQININGIIIITNPNNPDFMVIWLPTQQVYEVYKNGKLLVSKDKFSETEVYLKNYTKKILESTFDELYNLAYKKILAPITFFLILGWLIVFGSFFALVWMSSLIAFKIFASGLCLIIINGLLYHFVKKQIIEKINKYLNDSTKNNN